MMIKADSGNAPDLTIRRRWKERRHYSDSTTKVSSIHCNSFVLDTLDVCVPIIKLWRAFPAQLIKPHPKLLPRKSRGRSDTAARRANQRWEPAPHTDVKTDHGIRSRERDDHHPIASVQ